MKLGELMVMVALDAVRGGGIYRDKRQETMRRFINGPRVNNNGNFSHEKERQTFSKAPIERVNS